MEKAENSNGGKYSGYFSKRLKAGKRRTYFFDVKSTRQGDFFLTITESKKNFETDGYESHKIFLYKEDFKKFMEALNETVNYVKQELLPEYDFEAERPERPQNNNSNSDHNHSNHNRRTEREPREERVEEERQVERTSIVNEVSDVNASATPQISDDEQLDWN